VCFNGDRGDQGISIVDRLIHYQNFQSKLGLEPSV